MKTIQTFFAASLATFIAGCPVAGGLVASPDGHTDAAFDTTTEYTFQGLDDEQAYRITLVADANITPDGAGSATFVDNDSNGAADAGPSETIALITWVQGEEVSPAKTVPAGTDDPADPSGVWPVDGVITVSVTSVGEGAIHPVLYENGGASTFLEIDSAGAPVEDHVVGGMLMVGASPEILTVTPTTETEVAVGGGVEYTVSGLDDLQAHRITLVVADNVTVRGNMSGQFVDGDGNGAADAGASQDVALITEVQGVPVPGAKTVPGGDDDPAAPSGVFPVNGSITVYVEGVGAGTVYPVAYVNAGDSTFLELGSAWVPVEAHGIGGALTVTE